MIPDAISNPGAFVLCFPDAFEPCVFPGVCSVLAAVVAALPVFVLFWVTFTAGFVLSAEGCIFSSAVVLPVIANGENPGVCAVKYR